MSTVRVGSQRALRRSRLLAGRLVGIVPLLLMYAVFFLVPEAYFLRASFFRTSTFGSIEPGATLATWKGVINSFYLGVLGQTILLCVLVAVIATLLAYPLAYTIVKSRTVGRALFVIVVSTMFSSAVALVLGWEVLLSPVGPIARFLADLHFFHQVPNLENNMFAVVLGTVQAVLPITTIALMPGFAHVTDGQIEAAASLGANSTRRFLTIVLPQTANATIAVALLAFAVTAGAFTTPALLGGGKVNVLSVVIYSVATQGLDYSTASALSIVLIVVVAAVVGLALVARRGGDGSRFQRGEEEPVRGRAPVAI